MSCGAVGNPIANFTLWIVLSMIKVAPGLQQNVMRSVDLCVNYTRKVFDTFTDQCSKELYNKIDILKLLDIISRGKALNLLGVKVKKTAMA